MPLQDFIEHVTEVLQIVDLVAEVLYYIRMIHILITTPNNSTLKISLMIGSGESTDSIFEDRSPLGTFELAHLMHYLTFTN